MDILTILTIVLVLIAIGMIALILLQRGAGATAGAAFGSGASGTVFGARGAASFLTRTTGVMAAMFFAIALAMAVMVSRGVGIADTTQNSVMDSLQSAPIAIDRAPIDDTQSLPDISSADNLPTSGLGADNASELPDAAADIAAENSNEVDQGGDDNDP